MNIEILQTKIENKIFTIRGVPVMLDYHLAELYNVENKRLNEQVKRNDKRFPDSFIFQLSNTEWKKFAKIFKVFLSYLGFIITFVFRKEI